MLYYLFKVFAFKLYDFCIKLLKTKTIARKTLTGVLIIPKLME